ncbi:5'-3' exonuclease H3TH domain-containing protein [Priestia sp. SB1]|uniref:5'-3' exonuclease n=1 Tax=Priestia sp. SB1 TaxID=3132359 RepID=UPI00317F29DD
MKKIFLIDGSSMLSTQYYGNLPKSYTYAKSKEEKLAAMNDILQTSTGIYTNAVFNMTKTILKLIKDYNIEYLGVCWDISRKTFRRTLYPQYKAHRDETPRPLSSQFSLMQKVLGHMGIPQFKLENYEADDLIGSLSKNLSSNNQVYILSKDRDVLQLINTNTTVWLNTKQSSKLFPQIKELDNEFKHAPYSYFPFSLDAFRIIYGLEPKQLIDLKGLTGDTSDGIPGISNMGEKTATPILQRYDTIENFYEEIEKLEIRDAQQLIKDKGIKRVKVEKMLENKEVALLSKGLATINTEVPEYKNLSLSDLKINLNKEKASTIFSKLEFHSLKL